MSEKDATQPTVSKAIDATSKRPYCPPRLRKLGQVSELTETLFREAAHDGAPAPAAYVS